MAGRSSPGGEGPNFGPPPLPPGWIAQWDASSKKYYFVQLSTGASQWETPTEAAPVGGTPAPRFEHPYGAPHGARGHSGAEIIVHPDGSQTARYPDGRLEPVHPREDGSPGEGTRAMGDGTTDRGLGSFLGSTLSNLSGSKQSGGGGVGGLVSGLLSSQSGGGGGSSGIGGKLASQLASNLFSSSNKPSQPENFHGGQTSGSSPSGGLGGIVGGVASMLGGKPPGSRQTDFGYSNTGQSGGYSGPEPPVSYQPPSQPGEPTTARSYQGSSSYSSSGQNQPPRDGYSSYRTMAGRSQSPRQQSYPPPHGQSQSYSQPPYGGGPGGAPYGQPHYAQAPYPTGQPPYPTQSQYPGHQGYGGHHRY